MAWKFMFLLGLLLILYSTVSGVSVPAKKEGDKVKGGDKPPNVHIHYRHHRVHHSNKTSLPATGDGSGDFLKKLSNSAGESLKKSVVNPVKPVVEEEGSKLSDVLGNGLLNSLSGFVKGQPGLQTFFIYLKALYAAFSRKLMDDFQRFDVQAVTKFLSGLLGPILEFLKSYVVLKLLGTLLRLLKRLLVNLLTHPLQTLKTGLPLLLLFPFLRPIWEFIQNNLDNPQKLLGSSIPLLVLISLLLGRNPGLFLLRALRFLLKVLLYLPRTLRKGLKYGLRSLFRI